MQFKDIVGQQEIKEHLIQNVNNDRVSHAQLFLGPEGSGGLALAVAYAQFVNCENRLADDSCGECASCRKYSKLIHPDLHFSYPFFAKNTGDTALNFIEAWRKTFIRNAYIGLDAWRNELDAENKQANINIAECHSIIKKLSLKAFEAEYKVLIMWLPEYLDKEGNTLLKIIEEPPPKTLFILVAQNQDQILNTILSRTQLIKIPRLDNNAIKDFLVREKGLSIEKATEYAYLCEGNLSEALGFMYSEQDANHDNFAGWLRICFANNGMQIVDFVDSAAKWGRENQKNFIRYGINFLRECCMVLAGAENLVHLPPNELKVAKKLSENVLSMAMSEAIITQLEKAHYHIERNANPKILFLDVSLQLVRILKLKSLPQGTQHILL